LARRFTRGDTISPATAPRGTEQSLQLIKTSAETECKRDAEAKLKHKKSQVKRRGAKFKNKLAPALFQPVTNISLSVNTCSRHEMTPAHRHYCEQ
jgi:hypothetical protein